MKKTTSGVLNIQKVLFLFGPRSTGKTTLIRQLLNSSKIYGLLDTNIYHRLLKRPGIIEEEISDGIRILPWQQFLKNIWRGEIFQGPFFLSQLK